MINFSACFITNWRMLHAATSSIASIPFGSDDCTRIEPRHMPFQ
jgi:hypothetical protein